MGRDGVEARVSPSAFGFVAKYGQALCLGSEGLVSFLTFCSYAAVIPAFLFHTSPTGKTLWIVRGDDLWSALPLLFHPKQGRNHLKTKFCSFRSSLVHLASQQQGLHHNRVVLGCCCRCAGAFS